ncbi:ferritin-like domain-containing protein [Methylophilus medardicus]|uniref:Ferritin-like domain-containing protein n=1 Tax=Methylophilus medardicus TaxID=2588534 RepID=A0A5B8CR12_9PROT|nr:ferritin-like domain-containing protein [Methylophilus medardicus]QDC43683.1 ferritin-like domain-containing protein [Methylophilus medardicus]QDC48690.1 ferritin-like domain-containing protein [Methylophilus medardicus]QDC52395.1 ferritin-like domain-containing protein [Methylophilus medardicus]
MTACLRTLALQALTLCDPTQKCAQTLSLWETAGAGTLLLDPTRLIQAQAAQIPGRPAKPTLVPPKHLQRRAMNTAEGRAALIHALAHIEFNAINLALDAVWRFTDMPLDFYRDWLQVAKEEAYHFSLLRTHLQTLGFDYGDFDGHNSLWEMVEKTQSDVLARMALVPRTLEARGLDAAPPLKQKLSQAGDHAAAAILDIILRDEIGHVAIGNRWFQFLCDQRGLDIVVTFERLRQQYQAPTLRPPFNMEARKLAGFSDIELAYLNAETG